MKKIILVLLLLVLIIGCTKEPIELEDREGEAPSFDEMIEGAKGSEEEKTQLANPASVYCEEQGGVLRMETDEAGQYGICVLPDGTECEEWAYFRGECPEEPEETTEEKQQQAEKSTESRKPTLANFGFNLDYYDPETRYAGDFYFSSGRVPNDMLFTPTGHVTDEGKLLPYPGYHLPLETKIISPIDGVVTKVEKNDNADDYEIHMTQNQVKDFIVAFDHVINVKVKAGDTVVVGQELGEVAPWGNYDVGMTELEFFKGGNPPVAYCPFDFLEEDLKEEYSAMLYDLVEKWEHFKRDDSLFNEEEWVSPGCLVESIGD